MRPSLYIHLRDAEANTACAYRLDGTATGSVQHAPLETIAAQASGARVIVIVPAHTVHFLEVELPVRSRAKALAAAPFACEDRLAEDIDRLHFAHLGRGDEQHHRFAVVSHRRMRDWMERLQTAGITPDVLIPEVLCLPQPDAGDWCVLADGDGERLLIRQGAHAGMVTTGDNLTTILALSGDAAPERIRLLQLGGSQDVPLDTDIELLRQPEFGTALDVMIRHMPEPEAGSLLQGAYAPQSGAARYFQPWKRMAAVAAVVLLLAMGVRVADTIRLGAMAEAQKAENLAAFKQRFPDYNDPKHAQIARFLGAEARAAEGGDNRPRMLPLLESYARAAASVEGLQLLGMQWRDDNLTLNLRGESLENLESLRSWYRENSEVAMEVQNADAGSEGVRIRIRLSRSAAS